MKYEMKYWLKSSLMRKVALIVVFTLLLNPIAFNLIPFSPFNKVGASIAQAAVADRDGLGTENFWSFYGKDLGAGWKYSVNTFTGNLIIQKGLVSIAGRGTGLSEGLVYNSLSGQSGVLGAGWQLKNDLFLQENVDGSVTLKDGDATNHKFTKNADQSYTTPDGIDLALTKEDTTTFTIKDNDNIVFRFQNGLLVSITDEKGNATSFNYDANNRLSTITDASGRELTYSYDTNGRLNTITDPASRTVSFGYDASGMLSSVTDPKGGIARFSYDANNRLATLTDANNHVTAFFYDANGKAIKVSDARTNQSKEYATNFVYDVNLLKTTVTDPAGKSITYTHNAVGNPIRIQDGAGDARNIVWDKNRPVQLADANGSLAASYDSDGNITSVSQTLDASNNATTTIEYDSLNNPASLINPNGNQVTAKYDEESNMLSSANPSRKEADANTYDGYGNLTSSTDPGAPTYNIIQNGSFERRDNTGKPEFWYLNGTANAISIDGSIALYGKYSAKITSKKETTAYLTSHSQGVTYGQKLTLNVPVKMDSVTGAGGVTIGLEYYDADGHFISSSYSPAYTGTGETNLVVTSEAPANASRVFTVLELWNGKGTVWFDGAQLESPVNDQEGHILTKFDYVENSSFEMASSYWYFGGVAGAVSITDESHWAGGHSAKINLASSGTAWIRSDIISVRPGESLTLSLVL